MIFYPYLLLCTNFYSCHFPLHDFFCSFPHSPPPPPHSITFLMIRPLLRPTLFHFTPFSAKLHSTLLFSSPLHFTPFHFAQLQFTPFHFAALHFTLLRSSQCVRELHAIGFCTASCGTKLMLLMEPDGLIHSIQLGWGYTNAIGYFGPPLPSFKP